MRAQLLAMLLALGISTAATAENPPNSIPADIGNRANGRDYQPTPKEVSPREKAEGVEQSPSSHRATNQELWELDKNLLKTEGLSTKSVPQATGTR